MRVAKFLQHKHKHRPGISQKIRRYDKEPYIPVNLKASNEAVEENRLESKIRDVYAKSLEKTNKKEQMSS